ncbi:hypothetical protein [Ornithinimicrobium kibberense]|uniref:hypothetical protein n=1 Tax=Ornithinimicrobium kibberense TaxID=282060 RepID=UPI003619C222
MCTARWPGTLGHRSAVSRTTAPTSSGPSASSSHHVPRSGTRPTAWSSAERSEPVMRSPPPRARRAACRRAPRPGTG